MTTPIVALLIALALLLLLLALASRTHRVPGAPARHRDLPHRPAADAVPAPGPRHRDDDAHTASLSAGEVRRRLQEIAIERDALMRQRAEK